LVSIARLAAGIFPRTRIFGFLDYLRRASIRVMLTA
jgi:hypothetical protein